MPENKCTAWYVRETQIFWEFVHMDGEKEYKLEDHRWAVHKISSLGTSVEASDQGDQVLELPQPENIGAAQQDPTREEPDQGNQLPGSPEIQIIVPITNAKDKE